MAKDKNLELKVGAFVILGFFLLTIAILSVGDFSYLKQGKKFRVIFGFANGVKRSAPVRVAGVEAGLVRDVRLFFDPKENKTKVEVEIIIPERTKIPVDSEILINQLGLLGEKYIEIIPGINQTHFIEKDDIIIGRDPVVQEQISGKIMEVAGKVEKGIDGLTSMIVDENNQNSVKVAMQNLGSLTASLDNITNYVESGQGNIGKLIYDDRLYDDLQGLTADLRQNPWKIIYKPKEHKVRAK